MAELSTKPYLIRALYEWCSDSGFTPYLAVSVNDRVRVPMEYVKDGEIVLNISVNAARNLTMGNDLIQFSARFNGVSRELTVPVDSVIGIFAKENGQGMAFPKPEAPPLAQQLAPMEKPETSLENTDDHPEPPPSRGKRHLQVIK